MVAFNDPLVAQQWHFKLLGNINAIWDEYSGSGVHVGVYDGGFQYSHPDLNDRYDADLHFTYGGVTYDPGVLHPTPGQDDDGHGTSVAGIIAAEAGNGLGGVGVAWGATLTGVNILSHTSFRDESAFADELFLASIMHAAKFDIMSNSWGYDAYFEPFLTRADSNAWGASLETAFAHVANTGRDGLGTLVVKAAGNDAANSNGEGFTGSRHIINVAALTPTGQVTDYSNYGTNILVSAGAAEVTTDLMGVPGYGRAAGAAGDYTSDFGGTSAATPVVSGVIALMLDANDNLGWRDVREILATSAALTGSIAGSSSGFEVEGTLFQTNTGFGDSWNDGARAHSIDYGFGRVDAFAAVRMAEAWALFSDTPLTTANEQAFSATTGSVALPAPLGGNTVSLDVTEEMWIENVDVTISGSFGPVFAPRDVINIWLVAPDGTEFKLFSTRDIEFENPQTIQLPDDFSWTIGVSQALGMNAFGIWQLNFSGTYSGLFAPATEITEFSLQFFGRTPDLDNVHHLTKDYLLAQTKDATGTRDRIITDTDGGTDWINMSSIAGAVTATLDALGKISVGRTQWATIAAGSIIENIVTGDGKDRLTGSALANELHAMRGNDTAYGLGGNDTLNGAAGNDKLYGGADDDLLDGGKGNDILDGGLGNDTIYGGDGNDKIAEAAGDGDDVVYSGKGRDKVSLGLGNDTFFDDAETGADAGDRVNGGDGNDTLYGYGGADKLYGDAGADVILGGEGNDVLGGGADNDVLVGEDGDDSLLGDAGDDVLNGEAGNDILSGGAGIDSLTGGTGNDALTGGADADTFVFLDGFGLDRVTDFVDNMDQLYFAAGFWGAITDVATFVDTFAEVVGSNVVFDFEDGNLLTLTGVKSLNVLYDDVLAIA